MATRIDGARKVLVFVVTAIAFAVVAEADEYYKDENGVLHLLQRPAVSRDAVRVRERYQEEAQAQQEKARRHEEQVQLEQTEALLRQQESAQRQEEAAQRQLEAAAQHWVMVRIVTVLCLIGGGWVAGALAVGRAAMKKGRSYGAFFVLTLLLSPLLTGLIVACMRSEPKRGIATLDVNAPT